MFSGLLEAWFKKDLVLHYVPQREIYHYICHSHCLRLGRADSEVSI